MATVSAPRANVIARPARHGTCRLQLSINSTVYTLIPPHGAVTAWQLKKRAKPRSRYSCSVAAGLPACTCPDFNHRGVICKHLGALRACGILRFDDPPAPRQLSPRKGRSLLPAPAPAAQKGGAA